MKVNKFFSVAWDVIHEPKIEMLSMMVSDLKVNARVVAVGLWVCLLSMLYYCDGLIDLTKPARKQMLKNTLGLSDDDLHSFLEACESCELLEPELLATGHVVNHGVCDEIEYRKAKSEEGKKSASKRWKKGK